MIGAADEAWIRERFGAHRDHGLDADRVIADLVGERCPLLDAAASADAVRRLRADLIGLGVIDEMLADPTVTDVLINGPGPVWVEHGGRLGMSGVEVTGPDIAMIVERAFHRNGLSVDRARPIGDTRLADGSRLSAVLPPLVIGGPHVAVRRFADRPFPLDAFASGPTAAALSAGVRGRANIVIFGATGSGKTSLVNALATMIDPTERVVTIEDAAELRLPVPHVVRLECRPDNGDGAGRVDMRALVRAALRLRPDRLIVGEVRGPEALDMIWALATGHDGSMSTCHAKSAADALARLETFVLLADAALSSVAVRAQVRSAVDLVVGVARDGPRRVVATVDRVVADPSHPTGIEREAHR